MYIIHDRFRNVYSILRKLLEINILTKRGQVEKHALLRTIKESTFIHITHICRYD